VLTHDGKHPPPGGRLQHAAARLEEGGYGGMAFGERPPKRRVALRIPRVNAQGRYRKKQGDYRH
jgi:hypothetical protein